VKNILNKNASIGDFDRVKYFIVFFIYVKLNNSHGTCYCYYDSYKDYNTGFESIKEGSA